jgi:hypothetical protein
VPSLRDHLDGRCSLKEDLGVLQSVERLARRSSPRRHAELAREAMELLRDADPAVRSFAVGALGYIDFDDAPLVRLMTDAPELFRGAAPSGVRLESSDLWGALLRLLARRGSSAARALLRGALEADPLLAVFMAPFDADWLIEQGPRAVPRWVLGGVLAGMTPGQRPRLLEALGPWPDREAVLGAPWWSGIPHAQSLRAMLELP